MSYVSGFGNATDVKFLTLSQKAKVVIDKNRNLDVRNTIVRGDLSVTGNIYNNSLSSAGIVSQGFEITYALNNTSFVPKNYINYFNSNTWPNAITLNFIDADIDSYYNSPQIGTCITYALTPTVNNTYGIYFGTGNLLAGQIATGVNFDNEAFGLINSLIKVSNVYPKWIGETISTN